MCSASSFVTESPSMQHALQDLFCFAIQSAMKEECKLSTNFLQFRPFGYCDIRFRACLSVLFAANQIKEIYLTTHALYILVSFLSGEEEGGGVGAVDMRLLCAHNATRRMTKDRKKKKKTMQLV